MACGSSVEEGAQALQIDYEIVFEDGHAVYVPMRLDGKTLALDPQLRPKQPDWAKLSEVACPPCRLDATKNPYCPVAMRLAELVERFSGRLSHEKVRLRVKTAERVVMADTTLQAALSSVTGIFMVASGCPTMNKLRPMVRFHLPLATLDETRYRAVAMYLVAQYIRQQSGLTPDWSLKGLQEVYTEIHQVNVAIAKSIRKAAKLDANANALVRLDLFTDSVAMLIDTQLSAFSGLFDEYLRD